MLDLKTDRHEPKFLLFGFEYCYCRAITIMKLTQEQLIMLQTGEEKVINQRKICDYYFAPFQILKWFKLQSDGTLSSPEVERIKSFIYDIKIGLDKKYSFMEYITSAEIPTNANKLCTIPLATVGIGSNEPKFWLPKYYAWEVRHLIDNEVFENKDFKFRTNRREGSLDDIV